MNIKNKRSFYLWALGGLLSVSLVLNLSFSNKARRHKKTALQQTQALHLLQASSLEKAHALQKEWKPNNGLPANVQGFMLTDKSGTRLIAPSSDSHISGVLLRYNEWELHIQDYFRKILQPGSKVLCLGGHIGIHALAISRLVGEKGRVFVFEPNPKTLPFLRANIALNNNPSNLTLYPFAAFSENKNIDFLQSTRNTGASTALEKIPNSGAPRATVKALAIDSLKDIEGPIDLLQMDIEGCEDEAVKGMEKLITKSPNMVVIQEWTPWLIKDKKTYLQFWRNKGYDMARIDMSGLKPISDDELINMKGQCDLLIAKDLSPYL